MLVRSSRLRPGDLEVWERHEHADRVRARRQRRRLDHMARTARRHIARFLTQGPAYVSCSWGKDSMVALDLAMEVDPGIRVVHITAHAWAKPCDAAVVDAVHQRWPIRLREIVADDDDETWAEPFRRADRLGGRITGIRASESASRRMSAQVHGIATLNSCRPLLHWSDEDVWAWTAHRDLPVHPVYAMSAGGAIPRHALRVDVLAGPEGTGMGRAAWERMYYGDVIARGGGA